LNVWQVQIITTNLWMVELVEQGLVILDYGCDGILYANRPTTGPAPII
jgi:hypothetical protein